jgi:hypothetical protein
MESVKLGGVKGGGKSTGHVYDTCVIFAVNCTKCPRVVQVCRCEGNEAKLNSRYSDIHADSGLPTRPDARAVLSRMSESRRS